MMIDEIMKDDRVELVRFETMAMGYETAAQRRFDIMITLLLRRMSAGIATHTKNCIPITYLQSHIQKLTYISRIFNV